MATLYVSATGSNTSPYDTWAKAANELTTAVTAASSGDTIYGTGTFGPYNQIDIANKTITIQGYGAGLSVSFNGAQHGFRCTGTGIKTFKEFTITTGGDASHWAIYNDGSTQGVNLSDMVFDGWSGWVLYAKNAGIGTISKCIFKNNSMALAFAAATYTINYCLFYNNGASGTTGFSVVTVDNVGAAVVMNNCVASDNDCGVANSAIFRCTNGSFTLNNMFIFANKLGNVDKYVLLRSGGTFNVNNSFIQGPTRNPANISSGDITFTSCKLVDYPHIADNGKNEGYVSFAFIDSRHIMSGTGPGGVGTSFEHYMTVLNGLGVKFSYYPDDVHLGLSEAKKTQLQNGVIGGNDIGIQNSDSSNLNQDVPFTVAYIGGEANPRVIITYVADNNVTLELVTDAGTDLSISIGKGETIQWVGSTVVMANTVTKAINDHADWTVTCFDGISFDDTYAFCLKAGTTLVVGDTDILLDEDKWFAEHIVDAKALLESAVQEHASLGSWEATSFFYGRYTYGSSAKVYIKAAGFALAMSSTGYSDLSSISDMYNLSFANVDWTYFNAGGTEESIKRNARTLAHVVYSGAWVTIVLPIDSGATAEELNWFVGELINLGIPIKSHAEMAAIFADPANGYTAAGDGYTKTLTNNYNFRLGPESVCRDAGVAVAGLTTDFEGKPVPMGSAPDIGAYEFPVPSPMGLTPGLSLGGRMIPPRRRRR